MDPTKRLLRRVSELPCSQLTEWERGFVHGALTGTTMEGFYVVRRLQEKLRAFEAKTGHLLIAEEA